MVVTRCTDLLKPSLRPHFDVTPLFGLLALSKEPVLLHRQRRPSQHRRFGNRVKATHDTYTTYILNGHTTRNTRDRNITHSLQKMSFDKTFDLTAGVHFFKNNIRTRGSVVRSLRGTQSIASGLPIRHVLGVTRLLNLRSRKRTTLTLIPES